MNIGEQATLPAGNVSLCLSVSCGGSDWTLLSSRRIPKLGIREYSSADRKEPMLAEQSVPPCSVHED